MQVVEGLVRGIVAGSIELSESSGRTSHTVFLFDISNEIVFLVNLERKSGKDDRGACCQDPTKHQ